MKLGKDTEIDKRQDEVGLPEGFEKLPDEEAVRLIGEAYANFRDDEEGARFFLAVCRGESDGDLNPTTRPEAEERFPDLGKENA